MAENHPDELALLAYVEEELDAAERGDVADHLVACRPCADQVRSLELSRDALRAAPLLELPAERRDEMLTALPERRDVWRPFRPAGRALKIAAPIAAAAAFVGVVVLAGTQLGGGASDDAESAGEAAVAEESADALQMTAPPADAGADDRDAAIPPDAVLVRSVAGTPEEVVAALAAEGIEAEIVGESVLADARAADVRSALAGRAGGPVDVYVR